ncbi:PAS domain-containing protein [Desmonostoc muscorum LEGE 12446]|uniref:histidine kinase n=1 Tax=Desmonostoc muscorum LEGE 12446 TaxID=1828758 RepID=A0A8J7D540_DESMC|nr:PAS domain-containing protein [Desmonostoc muscorum]MCF2146644.1 PAS domain-containing protein [Desmonostoc muscorum LEGE 12446]
MQALSQFLGLESLESVIDCSPLMVVPETPLSDAIALMATQSKSVLVSSCSQLVGCFTKHDIVQLIASGTDLKTAKISEVMHTSVKTLKVSEFQEMSCALSLLCQQQLDLLPVVDNQGQVIGVITPESICQALAQEIEKTTDNNKQTEEQRRLLESAVVNESEKIHESTEIDKDITAFETLCESEQRFCIIADTLPVLISMSDSYTLGNFFEKWLEFIGRTLEQKLGSGLTQGVYSEDVQNYIASIGFFGVEYSILFPGQWHKYKWLPIHAIVLKDTTAKPARLIGVSVDITSHVQAKQGQLWQSQQMLQLVMDTIPEAVFPKDRDSVFLGYHPNFWQKSLAIAEVWSRGTDKTYSWYLVRALPLCDCQGKIFNCYASNKQEAALQECKVGEQKQLQHLLSFSPSVIYTCKISGDFGVTFVSENVTTITGYEPRKFVENSNFWASHIHPEDTTQVFAQLSKILEQGQYTVEYRFLHQDGIYRWIYDQGKLARDQTGNPMEIVGYWVDITERKKLEQKLTIALEKEKQLSELKSRFVSMTSHEFRTPLTTILSSCELLEHYRHKWTEQKQLTHLHRIQTAVKRMTEMLNDVLLIGKAGTGKLEYRPTSFDLVKYCQQLLEEIQMNSNNQRLISFISQYESIPCCMDDKLLGHIFNNLLSNAIKYSPDDSIIKFSLSCQNGQAVFEIQDWGIGIPEEDLPLLFESFHRASNVGNILGTGLGMAIVKNCVDIHEGEIFVTSTVGLGTKFTVIISLNNKI